jgi:hypothetical protein
MPWTIAHLVLWAAPVKPISIFVLMCPREPRWQLHRVERDLADPLHHSELKRDYPANVRFYYRLLRAPLDAARSAGSGDAH